MTTPTGLGGGGRKLWRDITADRTLDAMQRVQLLEACRAKDRLDKLDDVLRGDADTWMHLAEDFSCTSEEKSIYEIRITQALPQANATANLMKQLLAALRLPDDLTGKRPQQRSARGAQRPSVPGGAPAKVSSLDRARAAKSS